MSNPEKILANAEFDKNGTYTCNPFERSVETNIYIDKVSQINYKMKIYLATNPNATTQDKHDVILQDQHTWDVYYKSRECLSAIGIDPDAIASLDSSVQQAIAVPEFPFAILSLIVAIIPIIVFSRLKN